MFTGEGRVAATPNVVKVQMEVQTEDLQLTEAQKENALIMSRVLETISAMGIPRDQIQTVSYRITPMYDYVEGSQIFTGYEVVNAVQVTIDEIERAGAVIDAAVQAGVNRIPVIRLEVKGNEAAYKQALTLALADAQAKANTVAKSMNLQTQPIPMKIVEQTTDRAIPYRMAAFSEAATPIEPGTVDITAAVQVEFWYE